jgi:phosphinothricin acetyltransferase
MTAIRLAAEIDGPALAEIYRPAVVDTATSFEVDAPDGAEMARRVCRLVATHPWLVCDESGRVLGYAYASRHRDRAAYQWSVEVSAYVHDDAHRRGIGTALYLSLFEILRLLGYRNAFAGITLPNEASVGFHRALGFVPVGTYQAIGWKLGAWHDVLWLQRDLDVHSSDPPPPVALAGYPDRQALDRALGAGLDRVRPSRDA